MHLTPEDAQRLAGVLLDADLGDVAPDEPPARLPIGPFSRYRITRLIGVGGMGEVYEAQQDSPARRVAIKVIRPDLVSPELLRRFEHETRILARLQHPGIAPIYEAGRAQTAGGLTPFFAMEFVDGRPLTSYAAETNLPLRASLELFLLVCNAVEHAHRKGVIHRDLKPANILIDSLGQPRILDFGVARATDSDVRATTLHTEIGKLVGTLPYMSPEQAGGDPDDLDTRSDVYSLGVILYELLAGRPPYDIGAHGRLIPQALRTILDSEPAPLSSINRVFRGDIETIVGKALAKEKERRYQSVGELSADLCRYLHNEPIVARRPSARYQLVKFAARNRGLVAGAAATLLVLVVAALVSTLFALGESRASAKARTLAVSEAAQRDIAQQREREANAQAATARAVAEFVRQMLASVEPGKAGKDARVADMLAAASAGIDKDLAGNPEAAAMLRTTIAQSYISLGQFADAERLARESLQNAQRDLGPSNKHVRIAMGTLAETLRHEGRLVDAEPVARESLRLEQSATDGSPADRLADLNCLANILRETGRWEEAAQSLAQAVSYAQEVLGEADERALTVSLSYGAVLKDLGRYREAIDTLSRTLALGTQSLGNEHPVTLGAMEQLASVQVISGEAANAVSLMQQLLEVRERILPKNHPDTLTAMSNLADGFRRVGRLDDSEELFRRVLPLKQQVLGDNHPSTLTTMNNFALLLRARKQLPEAEETSRKAWEGRSRTLGERHPQSLSSMYNFALVVLDAGRRDEAQELLTRNLTMRTTALGRSHPETLATRGALGRVYKEQGRVEEAIRTWRELLDAGSALGDGNPLMVSARRDVGLCLTAKGDYPGAETELLRAWIARKAIVSASDPTLARLATALADLYSAWGKPDEAAKYRPASTLAAPPAK